MRLIIAVLALCAAGNAAEPLPILGLAHVGFQVSDMDKANHFYQGVLGYEPAFTRQKPDGSGVAVAVYKINEDQYLEVSPGLPPDQDRRMTHLSVYTADIGKMHRMLEERGLSPTPIQSGRDGNRNFSIKDPEGFRFEITQYMPDSLHRKAAGKALSGRRLSTHLLHAGIVVTNLEAALKFYRDTLGFEEFWRGGPTDTQLAWINLRMPGPNGDYVELMISGPAPSRQSLGSMQHVCLEVPDIGAAYRKALAQGAQPPSGPKVGRNRKWQLNLFDPDGSRVELMEPKETDRHVTVLNEYMRVLDVTDAPHKQGALHRHQMNRVMIYFDAGTQRLTSDQGKATDLNWKAGDVAWSPAGGLHTSENTGNKPIRIIEVELNNTPSGAYRISDLDPVKVEPGHYQVVLDNAQVRAYRVKLDPGFQAVTHEHLGPRLTVFLTDTKVKLTMPDNTTRIVEAKRGDMLWGTAAKHAEQNLSDQPWEAVIVEPK